MPVTRLGVVVAVVAVAWLLVVAWERRRARGVLTTGAGVTVFTSPTCSICPQTIRRLREQGPDLPITVVDVAQEDRPAVRSVPTVMVTDGAGKVLVQRSGRAALTDTQVLVDAARGVLAGA